MPVITGSTELMQPENNVSPGLAYLKVHGVLMLLGFGVCLPCAAIVARYCKLRNGWLRAHFALVGAGLLCITAALVAVTGAGAPLQYGSHNLLGTGLLLCLGVQGALGYLAHKSHDPEAKQESIQDQAHATVGKVLLVGAFINMYLGILKIKSILVSVPEDNFAGSFQMVYFLILILQIVFVGYYEYHYGPTSRYFSGNVFAAAFSVGGAKTLFSLPTFQRNQAIKRASIDMTQVRTLSSVSLSPSEPEQAPPLSPTTAEKHVSEALNISPRSKEGNTSPFLYRPQWDAGLKKATPINEIARVEQHMIQQAVPQRTVAADVLTRVRENEAIPRSRSNSVAKAPPFIMAENSSSSRQQSSIAKNAVGVSAEADLASAVFNSRPSAIGRVRSKSMAGRLSLSGVKSDMKTESSLSGTRREQSFTSSFGTRPEQSFTSSFAGVVQESSLGSLASIQSEKVSVVGSAPPSNSGLVSQSSFSRRQSVGALGRLQSKLFGKASNAESNPITEEGKLVTSPTSTEGTAPSDAQLTNENNCK